MFREFYFFAQKTKCVIMVTYTGRKQNRECDCMEILKREGILDLEEADRYQTLHGNLDLQVRKRPMYVIRGSWNAQAPDTNHDILGWALERLPYIPSVLITENHGYLLFATPGQCYQVSLMKEDDVVGYWSRKCGLVPVYVKDITHYIKVPTKNGNPYPKKWDLDAAHIIEKVDYKCGGI